MADERPSYWPRRTRARRTAAPTNPQYAAVARRAAHRCEYCLAPEALFPQPFPVDHVVPRAWGGLTFRGNLALAYPA